MRVLFPMCSWPGLPLDVTRLLEAADEGAMLPAVLPCVVEVLAFVHLDPLALRSGAWLWLWALDIRLSVCCLQMRACLWVRNVVLALQTHILLRPC
jgi:hypothetical protein